jgi:tetratricopeptide (TPR) repeat protein
MLRREDAATPPGEPAPAASTANGRLRPGSPRQGCRGSPPGGAGTGERRGSPPGGAGTGERRGSPPGGAGTGEQGPASEGHQAGAHRAGHAAEPGTGGVTRAGGEARQEIVLAREIRARGLVGGLTPAQIAGAIHDGCGPVAGTTWIRAYRLALGVSLADVVAQVRAWYASEGRPVPRFSETLLSAYESGQKRPGPEYLHYLCSVYRAEPSDLGYPGHCFCGRTHRDGPPARPLGPTGEVARPGALVLPPAEAVPARPPAGPPPSARWPGSLPGWAGPPEFPGGAEHREADAEDDDDVLRRAMLRMIADAAAPVDGQFLGAVNRIRRRMDDALMGGTVSATMLDQWEETTVGYGRQYMTVPPLRLLCDVLLDFGDVRRMCEQRQSLDFGERLCRLASQLSGLAGMIMIDVGDQRLARSFFRTARTAADETADRYLRAWVAVREALVPLYYGDPGEACALARAGGALAGKHSCVAAVMSPVLEARALAWAAARRDGAARSQALRRVGALLSQAHDAYSRLPAGERGDTAFGYTERQLCFHEGDTLVMAGHHQGAEKAFNRALRLYSPDEYLDRSLIGLGIARCRLEAEEPEEALRLSQQTLLRVPREHRSEIMVRAARALGESVAGRHGEFRAMREYRAALLSA